MTFDNGRTIIALRLRVLIASVLVLVYIWLALLGEVLTFPILGLESTAWTLIVLSIYTLLIFYPLILNYRYFYFSDDGPNLIIRYYSVGIFSGKKNSIEIPKNEFSGYKIEPYMVFFRMIYFTRKIDRRSAKYPPIHLSSLNRKEISKLISSLDSLTVHK